MEANHTYLFELVVTKDRRVSRAFHDLTVSPPFVITLRCVINCGRKINTNRRMIIETTCKGHYCLEDISYSWKLHQSASLSTNSPSWLEVQNLQSYILTNLESTNIVFSGSRKPLEHKTKYKVIASVLLRDEIVERGEMVFVTNSPPHNPFGEKGCVVHPKKGRVLQTKFKVACFGWKDEDIPLSYQLSYRSPEGLVIIASGNSSSFITMLPLGNQSENYEVKPEVQIFDSLGDASTVEITVQVNPLSKKEVATAVNKAIYGPNSTSATLLRSGNLQGATLTSYFTLTATEGTGLSAVETNSAKDEVLRHLAGARPQMLQEVTQLSAVVNRATRRRNNMTVNAVSNASTLLESMTNHLDKEANNSEDIDVIQQVGDGLLNGMSHVLEVLTKNEAAGTKHIDGLENNKKRLENVRTKLNKETPRMIEESVVLMDKLGTTLLSTKVVGESEPSVFKTAVLSMVLDRQTPLMLVKKRLQLDAGSGGVTFPSLGVLLQNFQFPVHSLDAQMITFKSNPFVWDASSRDVTSDVMDVSIKTNRGPLHLSKLEEPFELYIPLKHQKKKETGGQFFVKMSKSFENIRYHKIVIPSHKAVAIIEIVPEENYSVLNIFISAGVRPTPENYSHSTHVPNYSSCRNNITSGNGYQQCSTISPYRLLVSSSMTGATGIHYIGILLNKNSSDGLISNNTSTKEDFHRRHSRRSICNTKSGRKKRSCIGVKDPPTTPPPTPKIIKPVYNSSADANYTMSVSISSCLYWSKEKQQWTNDGCKVGPKTNPSKLHCLCTHLSAFGGDFFVAPNPIDFDKVWFEFGRLGETGNFVTTVVFCIYGAYFVGLLLARRADKKDQEKVVANVILSDGDQGGYIYEIQIQTGIWKGFGTTANVTVNIVGEESSSGPIKLTDFSLYKKVFSRGSVTNFVIYLPRSLGRLVKLCIWHDNFGQSPSWFLQQVMITEVHNGSKWHFFANKWIAVERGSGNLFLELRALDENERAGFKHLFYSKTSRSLGDEHLWVSLFTRPPHSPFTCCQRLSCCVSFLFTSMVANAMFYQFSDKPTHSFKFGPLVLSLRQIMIGIQSSFIAIPVNLLTVTIFRNVKPFFETSHDTKSPVAVENTSGQLPRCFVLVAWVVCILVTLASSAFTVFYSLSWGAEISNQWLTSIIVSLVQDVVFFQPVKVIVLAAILSLIIRTSPGKEHVQGATVYIDNKGQEHNEYTAPNEYLLRKAKEYGAKFLQMYRTIKHVVAFLIFVILLMVVCYGNRDSKRFAMTSSVENIFSGFNKVVDKDSFWVWTRQKLIPGLYHVSWYNSQPFHYQEGFLSNREVFLIGMPRLRQIRIKQEKKCQVDSDILPATQDLKRCLLSLSEDNEDKSQHYQRKWIPVIESN
ncbi:polycystin family receptor for egg jelly-like [Oculina patagonica]